MLLMNAISSRPMLDRELTHALGLDHVSSAAEAFGRNVCKHSGEAVTDLVSMATSYNPVSLAKRHVTVKNVSTVGRYLRDSTIKGARVTSQVLDQVNPVSIAIRHTPWYISKPLEFTRDEVRALNHHLTHPVSSGQELLEYFTKKPSRMAKLLRAAGVDVPIDVIDLMKMEEGWEKANEVTPGLMEKGADPVKFLGKDMAHLRGKMVLTLVKALMGDDVDVLTNLERCAVALLEKAGSRVMTKTYKVAISDKTPKRPDLERPKAKPAETTPDEVKVAGEDEVEIYYDALPFFSDLNPDEAAGTASYDPGTQAIPAFGII
ncbi:MAG: hypothetical protein ACR2PT_11785 [Endozoicomonas sp.]